LRRRHFDVKPSKRLVAGVTDESETQFSSALEQQLDERRQVFPLNLLRACGIRAEGFILEDADANRTRGFRYDLCVCEGTHRIGSGRLWRRIATQ
jgi:hypothetical protein